MILVIESSIRRSAFDATAAAERSLEGWRRRAREGSRVRLLHRGYDQLGGMEGVVEQVLGEEDDWRGVRRVRFADGAWENVSVHRVEVLQEAT